MASSASSKHTTEREGLLTNIALSAATGAINMFLTNPLDSLRIRWQCLTSNSGTLGTSKVLPCSVLAYTRDIRATDGIWRGLWLPGLAPNCLGCACSVGVRLGFYPTIRDALCPTGDNQTSAKRSGAMLASGLVAGAAGYTVAAPLFLVKTRLQSQGAQQCAELSKQAHARTEIARLWQQHGFVGLWRGAPILVFRGAVLSASQTAAYDTTKRVCKSNTILDDGPVLHAVASLAGAVSLTTAIIPIDVLLTRYQTASDAEVAQGPTKCVLDIFRREGPAGFTRGWLTLFVRMAPSSFFTFLIYEQLRRLAGYKYLD
eukprot:TRINITY_DN78340_c0_g1_i1.p1 TRINITY_DN78340_c0_g1~~TRINITY_DN78340_c0_g1_i1.p1  ORF type:complete len:316 (+),score=32.47 TRINITY_DN78340_c0_g1_i1:75-1022(+)